MSVVILSAEDMFKAFLDGVRKTSTTVIKPAYFNRIINDACIDMVKSKLPTKEFNQKRIDDLEKLVVTTDGVLLHMIRISTDGMFIVPSLYSITGNDSILYASSIPNCNESEETDSGSTTGIISASNYPLYMHGLNAGFIVDNVVTWARIWRTDRKLMLSGNPFRKPSSAKLYFEYLQDKIKLNSEADVTCMVLEYIRYPKLITFSETTAECVDSEFNPIINKEIVENAVRIYLERVLNPRYKSYLQEVMIRSQNI